ncbi:MAG TPA: 2-dehydropantoate 2-reductase N-terminal domain-containing protein [Chitinophagaceae bacterium]|nr:2-dehydropantoate 2-reductase N-terminal domain-containing protein [Chitinophagaceae bacterium]
MKILFYGAGVIGSVYAARLHQSHSDVTLLARGKRYETLKQNGVIIKDVLTGRQTTDNVSLIQELAPSGFYDLIIVTVRLDQLEPVIKILKQNTVCTLIMFMLNNPDSMEYLMNELAPKHLMLGFPGAGGIYHDNRVDYIQIKQQKTTIGEMDGKVSKHTQEIKLRFETVGFETVITANMQAWLKTHAVFVACVSASIIKENGNSIQLGKNKSSIQEMVKAISEGFSACKKLGLPIMPTNLKIIFMIMPKWFSVMYWQHAMQGKMGTLGMAPHANAAKDEMQLVAEKVLTIVHSSSVATPTLDKLLSTFINSK